VGSISLTLHQNSTIQVNGDELNSLTFEESLMGNDTAHENEEVKGLVTNADVFEHRRYE